MSLAIPPLVRVPATERGVTIADFLIPVRIGERLSPLLRYATFVVAGAILIYLCAQVTIPRPGSPVPYTLQTFGVLLVGGGLGLRRGGTSAILYVALGLVGLPFFAEGKGGIAVILGARGGYLIGFVVAAALVGRLAELGWDRRIGGAIGATLLGTIAIYLVGDRARPGLGDQGGAAPVRRHRHDQAPRGRGRVPRRVVGRRPAAQRPLIGGPPDPETAGLYGPGSEAWRLNREASLLLGAGPRALLMQVAHPLVAEGVDQHSDFRADPWARLSGTVASFLRIVYGPAPVARAEVRRLNALHRTVAGPVRDAASARRFGSVYAARDPALSLWVHATLVDSTIATVDAWQEPLPRERRARFYAETLPVGRLFGVPPDLLPADLDAFEAYLAGMLGPDGPVHPGAVSRALADAILHPALAPLAERGPVAARLGRARPAFAGLLRRVPPGVIDWALVPSLGLLPRGLRAEYGLAWGARERAIEAWLVGAWRAWRPMLPPRVRWFRQARAADERMASPAERPSRGTAPPG
jgi:uncharacterized protein (DUF2236 family)/biotin transporter BioY